MSPSGTHQDNPQAQGRRAEEVARWYFRQNGFLQISAFVLHGDEPRKTISEADLLGVRFPYSRETLGGAKVTDDRWISDTTGPGRTLLTFVEVTKSKCKVNRPWLDPERGGMEKVIRRIGFAPEDLTAEIAKSLYDTLQWSGDQYVVQYVAIGKSTNRALGERYRGLKQLTWSDVATFLFERFQGFGELKGLHSQWPEFGRRFAEELLYGRVEHPAEAMEFVMEYIERGE